MATNAREFVIIVGGPSNTFNGYGHSHESGTYHAEPKPAGTSPVAIERYLRGDPAHEVLGDPIKHKTSTHDLYWANFIYAAVKLVELRDRVPEAVKPAFGDILTFLVYLPPYAADHPSAPPGDRQTIDWDASPYNQYKHLNSPYVNSRPYNPTFNRQNQGTVAPPAIPPTRTTSTSHAPPVYLSTEADINHEILMRTTSETNPATGKPDPDGGFAKRPHNPTAYVDAITDIPARICYGSRMGDYPPVSGVPPLIGVFVKVLFVRNVAELYDYLATGTWTGRPRLSMFELRDEEHMSRGDLADCSWASWARLKGKPHPDWASGPAVDRAKVKMGRLDYVGHSTDSMFFLQYGMINAKGVEPTADVTVADVDLTAHLSRALFTDNAQIYLWGCYLGLKMAPSLAPLLKRSAGVRGCEGYTLFTNLLNAEKNLPEPADPTNFGWVWG